MRRKSLPPAGATPLHSRVFGRLNDDLATGVARPQQRTAKVHLKIPLALLALHGGLMRHVDEPTLAFGELGGCHFGDDACDIGSGGLDAATERPAAERAEADAAQFDFLRRH